MLNKSFILKYIYNIYIYKILHTHIMKLICIINNEHSITRFHSRTANRKPRTTTKESSSCRPFTVTTTTPTFARAWISRESTSIAITWSPVDVTIPLGTPRSVSIGCVRCFCCRGRYDCG